MIKDVSKQNFFQTAANQLNNFFDINARMTSLKNHVSFRRITLLFIIVFMNAEEIFFVWDINSVEQLKFWVKNHVVQFLEMLIVFREQRNEIINLILNLNKKLNDDKYETTMKNNSRFAAKTTHARNDVNQFRKLLILKRVRSMQLQKQLNAFSIFNEKTEQIKQLIKIEKKKSLFSVVFDTSRRENTFANLFFIHDIDFIIINEFSNDDKKFNKLSFSNKFIKKKNENFTFFDWLLKIQNCLFVNVDHYFTSKHDVIFIINRIFDYVSNHINVYREKKLNYFKISK